MRSFEGYIVDSYKLAKRILEVQPSSYVVVVSSIIEVQRWEIKNKINTAISECERVRILMPFNLINEEVINRIKKSHSIPRILVPNEFLRSLDKKARTDYSTLTDEVLKHILEKY